MREETSRASLRGARIAVAAAAASVLVTVVAGLFFFGGEPESAPVAKTEAPSFVATRALARRVMAAPAALASRWASARDVAHGRAGVWMTLLLREDIAFSEDTAYTLANPAMTPRLLKPEQQHASFADIVHVARTYDGHDMPDTTRFALAWALVANAWVESRLLPGASRRTGEESRGLFQINVRAHPRYKRVDLYDARVNTTSIIEIGVKDRRIRKALANPDVTIAQLTHDWCLYVERPRRATIKARRRERMVKRWLGHWATTPASELFDRLNGA